MDRDQAPILACPACGGHRVGRLGGNNYYCGDCCLELLLHPSRGRIELFDIDEEGNLTAVGTRRVQERHPPVH